MMKEYRLTFQVNVLKNERIVRPGVVSEILDIERVVPLVVQTDHFYIGDPA